MENIRLTFTKFLLFAIVLFPFYSCNTGNENTDTSKDVIDLSAMDTTVNPAQDFFEYVNGKWLKDANIPADKSGWGTFYVLQEKISHEIKSILDSCASLKNPATGSPAQQIGDLYASAMDSAAIEKAGLTPLKKSLEQIDSIQTPQDILTVISTDQVNGYGAPAPFGHFVSPDSKNSNWERLGFSQGGLGLPNKNYYFKTDSAGKAVLNAYNKEITKMLALSGEPDSAASAHAKQIIDLETKLAKASKSPVELRDPEANYHLVTVNEMEKMAPELHWHSLLNALQVKVDTLDVSQPEFFKSLSTLLVTTPISVWKEYLKFHEINNYAEWLSSPFFNAYFEFQQAKSGLTAPDRDGKEQAVW